MKTRNVALVSAVLSAGFVSLYAQVVDSKKDSPAKAAETPVELSPFEVNVSKDRGYLGATALSGTRLNSSLEDLASSITVITKEQMLDFAALDINDLFKYEAGTEGTATFTNFTTGANGEVFDQVQLNPQTSNRIRGLGSANISMDGFPRNPAIPIDPYNTERVELSRGANTSLFGLGAASGTVNVLRTQANLSQNISSLTLRGDSYGGYRSSIDLSRPIVRDKLALRL
ncbi:MAG: TonB-dependent receptor, partial [Opitutus sp.]|nr:TonB-dependent receptor [Opitutus sp.]